VNQRTDKYGGSIENRCRFPLQVLDALIEVFGAGRVGIKLSPFGRYQDISDSDPKALLTYLLEQLNLRKIAFVEVMEIGGLESPAASFHPKPEEQMREKPYDVFRPLFKGIYH
jgi:N-ethylmaleimide reductase